MIDCSTSVQILHDEIGDFLRFVGNDSEIFVQLHPLNRLIDQQRLGHKTQHRAEACGNIKYHKGNNNDETVYKKQCTRNIHRRILFNDHRNNIRTAA